MTTITTPDEHQVLEQAPKQLYIAGQWRDGSKGTIPVEDPATGQSLCEVADASVDDAKAALDAAVEAGPALHCCGIAAHLGMSKILAPPYSSVFSALGAGNMPQLHIHERSVPLILFDATSRAMFTDFPRFNAIVAELEARGRADLQRQGLPASAVRHRPELDMGYGNQLVTMAVVAGTTRLESIRDVVDLMRLFSEDYGRRFGKGSQSPEAGIWVTEQERDHRSRLHQRAQQYREQAADAVGDETPELARHEGGAEHDREHGGAARRRDAEIAAVRNQVALRHRHRHAA